MFGIDDAIATGLKVLDKFIPDPELKAKAEAELRSALLEVDKAQAAVNAAEATNPSIFVSGWRPFIGWVCGIAMSYQFVLTPIAVWLADIAKVPLPMPPVLDDSLWQLVLGMLGMAGLRTYEKLKGV